MCMPQIFSISQQDNMLRVLQTSIGAFTIFFILGSLVREEGEASSAFFGIERIDPVCWGKCPDYGDLWANFSLKVQHLGVPR